MEIHFSAETERKLKELAAQGERTTDDLLEEIVAAYLDELDQMRATLDRRYDEIKSGNVQLIPSEEVFEELRRRERER